MVIEDAMKLGGKDELDNYWKEHFMSVLDIIKTKGSYHPPRPMHPIRRFLFCQSHSKEYIQYANIQENFYHVSPRTYKEVCDAYITAYDQCASNMPRTALYIRKHLMELLTMYAKSCTSLKQLEPQRSIVENIRIR